MRLNKHLGESGACSRREADQWIEAGRVTVNGAAAVLGTQVAEGDVVLVDGMPLRVRPARVYLAFNKPGQGQVRYTLKTPYRDGTTHVVFEPLDFIARLAALEKESGGEPPPVMQTSASKGWAKLGLPAVREFCVDQYCTVLCHGITGNAPGAESRFVKFAFCAKFPRGAGS